LELKSAAYHRAAAAQTRRLQGEATTRRLKEHLEDVIVQHERIAEEIERTSEPAQTKLPPSQAKPLADNPRAPLAGLRQDGIV
jgi:hypothetical protein